MQIFCLLFILNNVKEFGAKYIPLFDPSDVRQNVKKNEP